MIACICAQLGKRRFFNRSSKKIKQTNENVARFLPSLRRMVYMEDTKKFVLVTDSTTEMPREYYERHAVEVVPLGFVMDNVNYEGEDGQPIDLEEFYKQLAAGKTPSTYQVTAEQAKRHVEPYVKAGKDVLISAFSSGLSGTYGSFCVAAKELSALYPDRKILVLDSLCASLGHGLFLHYLVEKAESGASIEETYEYGNDLRLHICHNFTVNDLFQLKRGGRISSTVAVIGSLLNIKPVMRVDDEGHLVAIGRGVMGRKKSINAIFHNMEEQQDLQDGDPVYIVHAVCRDDAEYLRKLVEEKFPGHEVFIGELSPVIGSHSGIGTLAIFFRGKTRNV